MQEKDLVLVGTNRGLISAFTLSEAILRWQYSVNDEVRSTPSFHQGHIVLGTDGGKVYCFDTEGRMKWMQDIGGAIRSQPLIREGVIYITAYNSKLTAIELSTGNVITRYPSESRIYSSPLFHGGRFYFGTNGGYFHCVEVVSD
ncbi:MAG: PQQ-binding-like beta-propeller repeat protein [Candidatus Latescibacteria bacterium]|nr:PQQ-binding-like beta-propeller repeat protein [bacterium]MBD3423087.1 PQQ-binding-like beta-propeller repeat protein [Candidatus Latescibacterota bacterium]